MFLNQSLNRVGNWISHDGMEALKSLVNGGPFDIEVDQCLGGDLYKPSDQAQEYSKSVLGKNSVALKIFHISTFILLCK